MFEDLSRKLDGVLKRLRGQGKISEVNVAETLREVRRVLLDADVNYKVAKQFIDSVTRRAVGVEVLQSITPGQLIVKILRDELTALLGAVSAEIRFAPMPPSTILVAGFRKNNVLGETCPVSERAGAAPSACRGGHSPTCGHRSAADARGANTDSRL